ERHRVAIAAESAVDPQDVDHRLLCRLCWCHEPDPSLTCCCGAPLATRASPGASDEYTLTHFGGPVSSDPLQVHDGGLQRDASASQAPGAGARCVRLSSSSGPPVRDIKHNGRLTLAGPML